MATETTIISLGGSLIVPGNVDAAFLKGFRSLIFSQASQGKKFVIFAGGGKIARKYQEAAKEIGEISNEELDWLGIHATHFNAAFLRILFGELSEEKIITDPTIPIDSKKSVILGGGWKPGRSTDYDAVMVAKQLGAKRVINLSNIDYAYDKDPALHSDAKRIEKITWKEYRELIPKEWNPGLNSPFDPTASELAEQEGIEAVIMNGKKLDNLAKCLDGQDFDGTLIF